jgi:hypothetical protein
MASAILAGLTSTRSGRTVGGAGLHGAPLPIGIQSRQPDEFTLPLTTRHQPNRLLARSAVRRTRPLFILNWRRERDSNPRARLINQQVTEVDDPRFPDSTPESPGLPVYLPVRTPVKIV